MNYTDTNQPRFDVEQPSQFWRVQSSTPTNSGQWKYTINLYEQGNTSSSHMGINPTLLPGTYELKPIPNDTILPGTYVSAQDADFIVLLWPNQFDGTCA